MLSQDIHTNTRADKLNGVVLPLLLLSSSERQLRVDIVRDEVLEVRLEESPGRLGLDAMQANSATKLNLPANPSVPD